MTVDISGTFSSGKRARVLHEGNRFQVKTVTASSELASYPGSAANAGDTVDRWRPFSNQVSPPDDFSDWTATGGSIGSDNQTFTEDTSTGQHNIIVATGFSWTAEEWVYAVQVERQTIPEIRIRANDGSSNFSAFFDLRDGTVSGGSSASIRDLGNNVFECVIYFTPVAASGTIYVEGSDGNQNVSYTGSVSSTIKIKRAAAHRSSALLVYDLFRAQPGDCIAIAASNLWSSGSRISIQHDSNEDDIWTSISTISPSDDSPIMFFFDAVTSSRWRISVDRGVLPEIGVFRVGSALIFQQPFYGGFSVPRMNRNTEIIGNISGSGELLGRSKKRTTLSASYSWQHLTYDWVRSNLDGPDGLIQSAEKDPMFFAWRPSETQDVDYLMRVTTEPPAAMGIRDWHTFSMSAEAYSYE